MSDPIVDSAQAKQPSVLEMSIDYALLRIPPDKCQETLDVCEEHRDVLQNFKHMNPGVYPTYLYDYGKGMDLDDLQECESPDITVYLQKLRFKCLYDRVMRRHGAKYHPVNDTVSYDDKNVRASEKTELVNSFYNHAWARAIFYRNVAVDWCDGALKSRFSVAFPRLGWEECPLPDDGQSNPGASETLCTILRTDKKIIAFYKDVLVDYMREDSQPALESAQDDLKAFRNTPSAQSLYASRLLTSQKDGMTKPSMPYIISEGPPKSFDSVWQEEPAGVNVPIEYRLN